MGPRIREDNEGDDVDAVPAPLRFAPCEMGGMMGSGGWVPDATFWGAGSARENG